MVMLPYFFDLSELLAEGSVNVYFTNVGKVGAQTVMVELPDPRVSS